MKPFSTEDRVTVSKMDCRIMVPPQLDSSYDCVLDHRTNYDEGMALVYDVARQKEGLLTGYTLGWW